MKIDIFEPELITRRGYNGFFTYFLSALVQYVGARPVHDPRPLPRILKPREHESAWIRCDGHLVFFDMSDHVQLLDLVALERADVYFKANLHRGVTRRILSEQGLAAHEKKLAPFLFFADGLDHFIRDARWRRYLGRDRPCFDICHVAGVYENPVRDGGRSPFVYTDEPMTPAACHFWIRWHVMQALRVVGIPGYYRLTSRANRALEDGVNVLGNLGRREFSQRISDGRITMVCTFPHALFPWKASESFVLGRPILIEQTPLTETPAPFMPVAGEHFLELLPEVGGFDGVAPLADARSHRVLARIPPERFLERAEWLRGVLENRDRLWTMCEACREFAARAYDKKTVAEYIRAEVDRRIG